MRLLLLNCYDANGGAAIAAMRLNTALRSAGTDSYLMAQLAREQSVLGPRGLLGKVAIRARMAVERQAIRNYPEAIRDYSVHVAPSLIAARVRSFAPELVHLHWVSHGMLRIEDISRLRAPLVWTMHDMWAFTGGCHYSGGCEGYVASCGTCPALGSHKELDASRSVWRRKENSWKDLKINLIAPSRWMASCARNSSLFSNAKISVIPNTLDTVTFSPRDKRSARRRLGLPEAPNLILFGAVSGLDTPRKGANLLLEALKSPSLGGGDTELVVLGSEGPKASLSFPLPVHYGGHVSGEGALADFYAAADVVVLPSVQDNLPNVALEALACGTPCVAFNVGGLPDLVRHFETGYLAKPFQAEDLASGILFCVHRDHRAKLQRQAREHVEKHFSPAVVARQHLELYEEILTHKAANG